MYNMKEKEALFKANDIRGVYPSEINDELFYHLGLTIPEIIKSKKIAIGMDIRLSSPSLFSELTEALNDQGVDVYDLGLCDTPYTYFIAGKYKLPCLMITASHNPAEFNGLKIILPGVKTLTDSQVEMLDKKLNTAKKKNLRKVGRIVKYNKHNEYMRYILRNINKKSLMPLKVAIDCSNGMAETILPALLKSTPAEVVWINRKADGLFPAHLPNPANTGALKQLQEAVMKEKADFGMMFDGDCDRVAFVDETGTVMDASITASIFTHYLLEKEPEPRSPIVYNDSASMIFPETISLYGGQPLRAKLGHRFMKQAMRDNKALFGAEYTGHYYFKSNFEADSGIIAGMLFYEIISKIKAPCSLLRKTFEKYYSVGEVNFHVRNRDESFKQVVDFIKSFKPDSESEFDGYSIMKKNDAGDTIHATVRKSNTEDVLRVTIESTSRSYSEEFMKSIKELLDNG